MSYIDLTLTAAPSVPASNHVEIYGDSVDGLLKYINSSGTISTISLPQSVAITASPTFASETLTNTTNQLVLGTTRTVTLTAPTPASSSRTITIPDLSGNYSVVGTIAAQSIAGVKSFTGGAGAITMSSSTIAMGSNNITGLANGSASTDAAAFGQIYYGGQKAIQVTSSTSTSTSSSTFTAATNQSVTITPTSSSNRIKVTVSTYGQSQSAATLLGVTLKRGSTELSGVVNGFAGVASNSTADIEVPVSFTYIDSPGTTSSTTYQVFFRSTDNSHSVQIGSGGVLNVIIAEEIV